MILKSMIFICLLIVTGCVTADEKMAMVGAKALKDLKCPEDTVVADMGKDRFSARCNSIKRGPAYYQVKCGKVPKSCRVFRFRR